ncbi:hypothetical protein MBLNU230_g0777t1 [Neophaeotheca triangularis]
MFIGGLNWETTDQSLKDYFSQFGEVLECTVMRDGATGRSRGFGFLTFKNPKDVNTVMVKEHTLDGKIIDPKRAIPREEQERTAKIFVGGVSQDTTDADFEQFFQQFGRVLDATLMMDKDTNRPRGFGFVTFDSEAAVDRTLENPLYLHNKFIEVKRAQPRGNIDDENAGGGGRGGRFGGRGGRGGGHGGQHGGGGGGGGGFGNPNDVPMGQQGGQNGMSPAMMAQYWGRMQQYFQMMQQQMAMGQAGGMGGGGMMGGMGRGGGMNPQMMQQMQAQMGGGGGGGGGNGQAGGMGGGSPGPGQQRPGFNPQEQMMFEQQKYTRQDLAARNMSPGAQQQQAQQQGGGGNFAAGQGAWDGMYDDVPPPAGMAPQGGGGGFGGGRGGFGGRGRGRGGGGGGGFPAGQAPANAPTGPKNANKAPGGGGGYRGGGRGGHRGWVPYGRGG